MTDVTPVSVFDSAEAACLDWESDGTVPTRFGFTNKTACQCQDRADHIE